MNLKKGGEKAIKLDPLRQPKTSATDMWEELRVGGVLSGRGQLHCFSAGSRWPEPTPRRSGSVIGCPFLWQPATVFVERGSGIAASLKTLRKKQYLS